MAPQDILAAESGIISNMAEGNSLKSPLYFGIVPFDKNYSKNQEKFISIAGLASKLSFNEFTKLMTKSFLFLR